MGVFFYLINLGVVGLFVGALGRLIVPGRNRIGLGATFGGSPEVVDTVYAASAT